MNPAEQGDETTSVVKQMIRRSFASGNASTWAWLHLRQGHTLKKGGNSTLVKDLVAVGSKFPAKRGAYGHNCGRNSKSTTTWNMNNFSGMDASYHPECSTLPAKACYSDLGILMGMECRMYASAQGRGSVFHLL